MRGRTGGIFQHFIALYCSDVLFPGNVYCALQNGNVVLPEVSPPPLVTILHASSDQCITPSLPSLSHKHLNTDETILQHIWFLAFFFTLLICKCFSQLSLLFVPSPPILVSSLLQRWSPWLTLNTSYCLCTLRLILGKTGSGEKMTMITPDWPSKTFL